MWWWFRFHDSARGGRGKENGLQAEGCVRGTDEERGRRFHPLEPLQVDITRPVRRNQAGLHHPLQQEGKIIEKKKKCRRVRAGEECKMPPRFYPVEWFDWLAYRTCHHLFVGAGTSPPRCFLPHPMVRFLKSGACGRQFGAATAEHVGQRSSLLPSLYSINTRQT